MAEIPPPETECPTDQDVGELARLLPRPKDAQAALAVEEMARRFVDAAAYCQTAAKRLQ